MSEPRAGDLVVQATILARQVVALTQSVQTLDLRANRSARATRLAMIGLVLDLILSAAVVGVLIGQSGNDDELAAEIDRQARVRVEALCPLYELLMTSENPRSRQSWPEGPEAYDAVFVQLADAYAVLDCGPP